MESIIMNQRKFVCELFMAFSTGREVEPRISNDKFIWKRHDGAEYYIDRDDNISFRASGADVSIELLRHWDIFSKRTMSNSDTLLFTNWYTAKNIPKADPKEEDLSEYVLIDIDGWRKHFEIGYYSFGSKTWNLKHGDKPIDNVNDIDNIKWTYLPLNKE